MWRILNSYTLAVGSSASHGDNYHMVINVRKMIQHRRKNHMNLGDYFDFRWNWLFLNDFLFTFIVYS